jgi:hypothetical protein
LGSSFGPAQGPAPLKCHFGVTTEEPRPLAASPSQSRAVFIVARRLRLLRVTWLLWLGSFVALYAYPVVFLFMLDALEPAAWRRSHESSEPWRWDPFLWVPMVLAVLVPRALHRALARRVGSPFVLQRDVRCEARDYRSPYPWKAVASEPAVRLLAALYAGRLGVAVGLSFLSFRVLMQTTFFDFPGLCTFDWRLARSLPEYLAFATALLGAAVYHVPTTRRVLGLPPHVGPFVKARRPAGGAPARPADRAAPGRRASRRSLARASSA